MTAENENENVEQEVTPPTISANDAATAPPRKRGRPPGSTNKPKDSGDEKVTEVSGGKKRGRPPGKRKKQNVDIPSLARQLQGLHMLGSMATGIPELQIGEQEASALAEAVANVAVEYNLSIDGKTGAFIQLAAACAGIYVPRYLAVNHRLKNAGKIPRPNDGKSTQQNGSTNNGTPDSTAG